MSLRPLYLCQRLLCRYHVFEIGDPFLTYQINVTVQQYDTRVRVEEASEETREVWNTLGYATVGPERPGDNTANNKDGKTSTPMVRTYIARMGKV